jgi:hypothetical protein
MMAAFFIHLYPMTRVIDIFLREVGFKTLYAGIAYVALRGIIATPQALALLKDVKKRKAISQNTI